MIGVNVGVPALPPYLSFGGNTPPQIKLDPAL
jgi:hypothetical protein